MAALFPSDDQSITPAKKVISLLSCWFLGIRDSKKARQQPEIMIQWEPCCALDKSVSYLGARTSNTIQLSVVGTEAHILHFCLMITLFMGRWHDPAPEPQGPSMGFSHWGLPQTPCVIFTQPVYPQHNGEC